MDTVKKKLANLKSDLERATVRADDAEEEARCMCEKAEEAELIVSIYQLPKISSC